MTRADDRVQGSDQRLVQSMGSAVIASDLDGTVRTWNAAAEHLYGWAEEEALGQIVGDLVTPAWSRRVAAQIRDAVLSEGAWSGVYGACRKDGSALSVVVTNSGLYDDAGTLVGIVSVSSDVRTALFPLFGHAADAAIVTGPDGVVTYASPAVATLFGWDDVDVVGHSGFSFVHPEDAGTLRGVFDRIAAVPGIRELVEFRVRLPDETWAWVEASVTNLLRDPVALSMVWNLREVTDRHRDREELERLTRQLQEALVGRVPIEQAKGFLSARYGIGTEHAFTLIKDLARSHGTKVRDVARLVLADAVTMVPGTLAERPAPDPGGE